jgi:prophage tail gpP-like protein
MKLSVSINGVAVSGLMQAVISTNNYYSSDTFSLTFAMGAAPLRAIAWWALLSSASVQVSYSGSDLPDSGEIITGDVDAMVIDPIAQTVSIEGRDLSARLIDSYVQQDFVNQTASDIVSTLAVQFGLNVQVTETDGSIGRYFEDGYTKLSLGQFSNIRSNWDLVVQLAREQTFDVFVQGTTLAFQPAGVLTEAPVTIGPRDVMTLHLEQNLALQATPAVTVQSWSSQQMAAYSSAGTSDNSGTTPGYLFSGSNLTASQADAYALQYTNEVNRLRTTLRLEMPWSLALNPRRLLNLNNTNSSFDGLYQIDQVDRHYSSTLGSTQTVRAVSWYMA